MSLIDSRELYDVYRITLQLRDKLCGGVPKNPALLQAWIEAGTGHKDEVTEEMTEAAKEEMIDTITEKSWNGFKADRKHGLFLETRCVKAMFKECASVLGITKAKRGSRQVFQHGFEVKSLDGNDSRIYFGVKEADGFDEQPIHVMTPQGPRTALKRVDYLRRPKVEFELWVLKTAPQETRHLGEKEITECLRLGQENGLGADRSQGHGKFEVLKLEKIEKKGRRSKAA